MDPKSIKLNNLEPGEEIKLVLQRHWICLVYIFLFFIVLVIITGFIYSFKDSFSLISPTAFNIILIIFISTFSLFIYIQFIDYELNLFIITNKRIIFLKKSTFLNRHISECFFEKVQEINAKTVGVLSNGLKFGIITIHTVNKESDFEMLYLPDVFDSARAISNIINENKTKI
ncbi:hypothetical protein KAZ01_00260 [Candidatus Gracilibacteria bacterium]|nr:hypothetical protein [Candidatus Gracilibacteria bacterium]